MTRRLEGKNEAELFKMHSKGMALIESVLQEAATRACERAGDDRLCDDALASAEFRELLHMSKALHARADKAAATYGGFDVARGGDR